MLAFIAARLTENIDIAGDERILRDDADRVAKLAADFEAPPCDLQVALDRLIRIGDAAEVHRGRLPFLGQEFAAQQFRRIVFHHDLGFEIEPGREAEILVIWPSVAIGAAVLAAAIRIDAVREADVGTVVVGDDRARVIDEELRARRGASSGGHSGSGTYSSGMKRFGGFEAAPRTFMGNSVQMNTYPSKTSFADGRAKDESAARREATADSPSARPPAKRRS